MAAPFTLQSKIKEVLGNCSNRRRGMTIIEIAGELGYTYSSGSVHSELDKMRRSGTIQARWTNEGFPRTKKFQDEPDTRRMLFLRLPPTPRK